MSINACKKDLNAVVLILDFHQHDIRLLTSVLQELKFEIENLYPSACSNVFSIYNRLSTDTNKLYMETLVNHATLVGEMFDAFKKGDIDVLLSHMHPDITWTVTGSSPIPYAGTYKGREHTATFFSALAKAVTFQEFVPERILNADDHTVVSIGHFKGTVIATGKEFMSEFVMIDEFDDDGLVVSFHDYTDSQKVAKAFL